MDVFTSLGLIKKRRKSQSTRDLERSDDARQRARDANEKFFKGVSCKRDHNGLRYTHSGQCVECTKQYTFEQNLRRKARKAQNADGTEIRYGRSVTKEPRASDDPFCDSRRESEIV